MASRFSVETIFRGKDLVSKVLDRQIRKQRKLAALTSRQNKAMAAAGKTSRLMGKGFLAVGAGTAIAAVGMWKLTEAGRSFDEEMSKVRANMGDKATERGMEKLRKKAAELGATTEHTSAQAASGLTELAKAGFTTEQSLGAVTAVLAGASAGEMDMAASAAILTSTMAGFGLKSDNAAQNSKNAARVMDVLAVASTSTKSSIASLGESLKSVSPIAKQFGFSIEQSVAMVAKMQDVGIEASEAGNAIKTMLTKLTAQGPKVTKMLDKLGVSFVDATTGDMLMPEEIFAQAAKLKEGLKGNAAEAKAFADIVGMRGQKALTILTDVFSSGDGTKLIDQLKNSAGAAERIAKVKLDNLNGDVTKLGSAWDGLTVAINDSLKGSLRPLIQEFTAWMGNPETKESITYWTDKFVEWAPLLWNVAIVVGTVAAGIWLATTAMAAWSAATLVLNTMFLLNPVGLAIGLIIAAIALVIIYWDEFKIVGLMAMDALAAPAIFLYNKLVDINRLFGGTMEKLKYMQATEAAMEGADREANFKAMDAARSTQGGGGTTHKVGGTLGITVSGPGKVTSATGTGGMTLKVPRSGGV